MGSLHLVGDGLADVVKQAGALDRHRVDPELAGQHRTDVGRLDQMVEDVLAVAGPVLEPTEESHEFGMHLGEPDFDQRPFAGVADRLLHLGFGLFEGLFDRSRVDAAIGHELLEGDPGDLPTDRVEGRHRNRLGGVIDDEIDPGDGFEGADVATLPTDDAALHVVGREGHHRHGRFGDDLGGQALDGSGENSPAPAIGLLPRFHFEIAHQDHGVAPGVVLDLGEQLVLGGLGVDSGRCARARSGPAP